MNPGNRVAGWRRLGWVACFGVAAITLFEMRAVVRQREQLRALQELAAQRAEQFAVLQRELSELRLELSAAEQQLAKLVPPLAAAEGQAEQARVDATKAWLARVRELKRLFSDAPGRRIPEMDYLNDEDWLRVAQGVELDSEPKIRKAMADTRSAAKSKFARVLVKALQKFADVNLRAPFASAEITTYFNPPVASALLDRYAVKNSGSAGPGAGAVSLNFEFFEKSPVDEDYDTRYLIWRRGFNRKEPPAWIEIDEMRTGQAEKAYTQANHGAWPTQIAQLIPYFDPPLPPADAAKLLKAGSANKP